MGKRCLLVDFDPQANASAALGASPLKLIESIYHGILGSVHAERLIQPTMLFNFHFIPAAPHLAGILIELVGEREREFFLRKFLHLIRHQYDYIFIDLPPSLSLLTVNGLVASDEVLIPVQAEYFSLEGLGQLLQTIDLIRKNLKINLGVSGALLTMIDRQTGFNRDVAENVRKHFPHYVFSTEIPRDITLAEAPSFLRPVILYRPESIGARAYRGLAREILDRERTLQPQRASDVGNFNIPLDSIE
jgi:chromosome partitioning protein